LNEQLKRELSELLRTEVRDPRVGLVTVTGVEITRDLSLARVYVRPGLQSDANTGEMLSGLAASAPYLRGMLGKSMKVRRVPELRFQLDRSLDHARRIEEILSEVLPPDEEEPGDGDGEADP